MLNIASGASRQREAHRAAREVAAALATRLSGHAAQAAVFFATPDQGPGYDQISRAIREATGAEHVVGCTASGVVCPDGSAHPGSGVSAMAFGGDFEARRFFVPSLRGHAHAVGREVGRVAASLESGPKTVMLFPDSYNLVPDELLLGLEEVCDGAAVLGAGASEDGSIGQTLVFGKGAAASNAVAGLAIGGLRVRISLTSLSVPVGRSWTITKAEGNRILALEGQPALEEVLEELPPSLREHPGEALRALQAALARPEADPAMMSSYVLRPVLGGDPGRSALLVGDEVRPGMSFRLAVRDPAVGRSRLAESIAALGQDSDSPAGLLYFHSALQGQALYGLPELDTAYVRRDLGEAELAGFASYVLFAPMLGRSQFHHFSSVLVGLGCRADQVAEARVGSGPGRRIE